MLSLTASLREVSVPSPSLSSSLMVFSHECFNACIAYGEYVINIEDDWDSVSGPLVHDARHKAILIYPNISLR